MRRGALRDYIKKLPHINRKIQFLESGASTLLGLQRLQGWLNTADFIKMQPPKFNMLKEVQIGTSGIFAECPAF